MCVRVFARARVCVRWGGGGDVWELKKRRSNDGAPFGVVSLNSRLKTKAMSRLHCPVPARSVPSFNSLPLSFGRGGSS